MKIILASTSKFKSEILTKVGIKHTTHASLCEEKASLKDPSAYVKELARKKAMSLKGKVTADIIIGLDTIVLINNKIIEKPRTKEEAIANLMNSSNKENKVLTGITIINQNTDEIYTDVQSTTIKFKKIRKEDIDYYIEHEPDVMDASGFIIENMASNFIERIEGSYYNILGAPVEKIYEILNQMDIYLKEINE